MPLTIAIPTYRRGAILINTIESLFKQRQWYEEILVLDQTLDHKREIEEILCSLSKKAMIRWIRFPKPSIPKVMNVALLEAKSDIVLFLDDDILPGPELAKRHMLTCDQDAKVWACVGKIIQPESSLRERQIKPGDDLDFSFDSEEKRPVQNVMAGNLSVKRREAVKIGGFDENFVGAAYRFETEFAERLIEKGGDIIYEPSAVIQHLRAKEGGTRSYGDFKKTIAPHHCVGAYYYCFHSKKARPIFRSSAKRFLRSIYSRHHLLKPWWIPVTMIAELLGLLWAIILTVKGPRYIKGDKKR